MRIGDWRLERNIHLSYAHSYLGVSPSSYTYTHSFFVYIYQVHTHTHTHISLPVSNCQYHMTVSLPRARKKIDSLRKLPTYLGTSIYTKQSNQSNLQSNPISRFHSPRTRTSSRSRSRGLIDIAFPRL